MATTSHFSTLVTATWPFSAVRTDDWSIFAIKDFCDRHDRNSEESNKKCSDENPSDHGHLHEKERTGKLQGG